MGLTQRHTTGNTMVITTSDTKAVFLYYRSNGSLVAILVDEKGFCDYSPEEDSVGLYLGSVDKTKL